MREVWKRKISHRCIVEREEVLTLIFVEHICPGPRGSMPLPPLYPAAREPLVALRLATNLAFMLQ